MIKKRENCTSLEEYLNQYINENLLNVVKNHIGIDKIKASKDIYFTDIPLERWKMLHEAVWRNCNREVLIAANEVYSINLSINIAKQCARVIQNE